MRRSVSILSARRAAAAFRAQPALRSRWDSTARQARQACTGSLASCNHASWHRPIRPRDNERCRESGACVEHKRQGRPFSMLRVLAERQFVVEDHTRRSPRRGSMPAISSSFARPHVDARTRAGAAAAMRAYGAMSDVSARNSSSSRYSAASAVPGRRAPRPRPRTAPRLRFAPDVPYVVL